MPSSRSRVAIRASSASVATGPGPSALTRMPRRPRSSAAERDDPEHGVLARDVARDVRVAAPGVERADQDDGAAVAEHRRRVLERRDDPADVDGEDLVPAGQVGLGDAGPARERCRRRATRMSTRLESGRTPRDGFLVAHVDRDRLPAARNLVRAIRRQVEHRAARSLGGEAGRRCAAPRPRAPPVTAANAPSSRLTRAPASAARARQPGSPPAQSTSTITSSTPAAASSGSRGASSAAATGRLDDPQDDLESLGVAARGRVRRPPPCGAQPRSRRCRAPERLLPEPTVADRACAPQRRLRMAAEEDRHRSGRRRQAEHVRRQPVRECRRAGQASRSSTSEAARSTPRSRAPRVSNGTSRASNSSRSQPAPTPSRSRPAARRHRSTRAASRSTIGCRSGSTSTAMPKRDPLGDAGGERERNQRVEVRSSEGQVARPSSANG